jgi:hypothetical protein
MSIVSGLSNIKIPFVIPNTNPNASGFLNVTINGKVYNNTTVFTTLNRGVWWLNWSPRVNPVNNNQITQYQFALTINNPFGVAGNTILATSPLVGTIGQQPNQPVTWCLSNIFTITADNTPVYVYMNVIVANTNPPNNWFMGVGQDVPNLDDVDFVRIA